MSTKTRHTGIFLAFLGRSRPDVPWEWSNSSEEERPEAKRHEQPAEQGVDPGHPEEHPFHRQQDGPKTANIAHKHRVV